MKKIFYDKDLVILNKNFKSILRSNRTEFINYIDLPVLVPVLVPRLSLFLALNVNLEQCYHDEKLKVSYAQMIYIYEAIIIYSKQLLLELGTTTMVILLLL